MAVLLFMFGGLLTAPAGAFTNRQQIERNVLKWTLVPPDHWVGYVYILGTDNKLWRENYLIGGKTLVDTNAADFHGVDNTVVYVLGDDCTLWREVGDNNTRTQVDTLVRAFSPMGDGMLYVLRTDGNLWLEYPDQYNRTLVDTGVDRFQWAPSGDDTLAVVYALHTDGNLWRNDGHFFSAQPITSSWMTDEVEDDVLDFRGVDGLTYFALGHDGKLWREYGDFHNKTWVDGSVESFVPLWNSSEILVLGTDHQLWREFGDASTRDFVDNQVFGIDYSINPPPIVRAPDYPNEPQFAWANVLSGNNNPTKPWMPAIVLGHDRALWLENLTNPAPTPTCTPQGAVAGSLPCCAGYEPNQGGICSPKDPPDCGVTSLAPTQPCCKNKAPCTGAGTCVVDKTVNPPYWYCAPPGNASTPPSTPNPIQTGGATCTLQPCLVSCLGLTANACEFGYFCSDQLAAAAAGEQLNLSGLCDACCGLADCQSGAGWNSDKVCAAELGQVMNPP